MSEVRGKTKIIRNDDVSYDTELDDIKWFCELCDKHNFKPLHCITSYGSTHDIDVRMNNETIRGLDGEKSIYDNKEVLRYLQGRGDLIAVHGLHHTHEPSGEDIERAKIFLESIKLRPTYFVPPFNEGNYGEWTHGLIVSAKTDRMEDFHNSGEPQTEIAYLHSWRYGKWYKREDLERCLQRITTA